MKKHTQEFKWGTSIFIDPNVNDFKAEAAPHLACSLKIIAAPHIIIF